MNNEIGDALIGLDAVDQRMIDRVMCDLDGTPNKKRLGANAILGASLATARRRSSIHSVASISLSGWRRRTHSTGADDEHRQRWPARRQLGRCSGIYGHAAGFDHFSDALRAGTEIFHHLKKVLSSRKLNTAVGDEGGFAPDLAAIKKLST